MMIVLFTCHWHLALGYTTYYIQPILWPAFGVGDAIDAICFGELADQQLICKSQTDLQPKGWQPTCIDSCRAQNVGILRPFHINFCSIRRNGLAWV